METMQSHIDNLMSMIKAQPVAKSGAELSVKLVALKDDDDIESYLITFERIMAAHKVGKERWPHYLAPQLAGKALLAFAALSITEVGEYEAIKDAILIRYNINEEAYRNRFRTEKRKDEETNREFSVRSMDNEHPANEHPANEHPANEHPANEHHGNEHHACGGHRCLGDSGHLNHPRRGHSTRTVGEAT